MHRMTEPSDQPRTPAEHVQRYRETDGAVGGQWRGAPALLLTTIGRRSGEPRTTPLVFGRDGENYILIASKGGAPEHPAWYLNLCAHPEVRLQVMGDKFAARARTATPAEKPRLWKLMTSFRPSYDEYQSKTDRQLPVVIVERV
jgi:deazaflavin-dependent oxidoreductase (nitroreductase family)